MTRTEVARINVFESDEEGDFFSYVIHQVFDALNDFTFRVELFEHEHVCGSGYDLTLTGQVGDYDSLAEALTVVARKVSEFEGVSL